MQNTFSNTPAQIQSYRANLSPPLASPASTQSFDRLPGQAWKAIKEALLVKRTVRAENLAIRECIKRIAFSSYWVVKKVTVKEIMILTT